MESEDSKMVVYMDNGKAKSKIIDKSFSIMKSPSLRLSFYKKENFDLIQAKRIATENSILLDKVQILKKKCDSLTADLELKRKLALSMETFNKDINSNITTCPQCGCNRCHMTTDLNMLVEQANKNSLDNRVRLTIVDLENTLNDAEASYESCPPTTNDLQHQKLSLLYAKLQEELVACKLREAESCLGFKELQAEVKKMEKHWQNFVRDIENSKQSCEPNWKRYLELKESYLSLRIKDASLTSDFSELKQKLMELETENNVYKRQEKKLKEVISKLEDKINEVEKEKEELGNSLRKAEQQADFLHTQFKDKVMMHKIREAEQCQAVASLRRSRAELEIENQQLMASLKLRCSQKDAASHKGSTAANHDSLSDHEPIKDVVKREKLKQHDENDVNELLSKCDMSDIMTESFYADTVFLQNNLQSLTHYDCMASSGSNHTLHDELSDTDSLS